ncbi:hypothetical protein K1719_045293 [Acacia pycnantha]|nr:hypothetical protein K1719_045293 [Acacia pycnantha]
MGVRTTIQSPTQETPFRMTYGCEAMIPVEVGHHLGEGSEPWRKENRRIQGHWQPRWSRADIGNKNAQTASSPQIGKDRTRVKEKLEKGAYVLETPTRKSVKRTWNGDKLRAYYS